MIDNDDLYTQNQAIAASLLHLTQRLSRLQSDVDDIRLRMRITTENHAPSLARITTQLTDIARGLMDLANRP